MPHAVERGAVQRRGPGPGEKAVFPAREVYAPPLANYNYRCVGSGAMYCPRCERTIKKEKLEELDQELKRRFDRDSIERGKCPVCDTPLIQLNKEEL